MQQPISISDITKSIENKIDLFICSSSFEERSNVVAKSIVSDIKAAKKIVFYSINEYQKTIDNSKKLETLLHSNVSLIALNTDAPTQNAIDINNTLDELFETSTPINTILLDTTTFTHESLLVIYRLLEHKKEKFKQLYVVYVGAKDYSTQETDSTKKWLSSGISSIRTVIGYPGFISPARKNHLIILFGFESDRTKSLIKELQFDMISLGFGPENKSIDNIHQSINYERHCELMNYFEHANKFELSLIDPFEAKSNILALANEYSEYNTVISPMNNKLSTLGAALASIENPKIQLIYAKPVEYNVVGYSDPRDDCYLYQMI